MKKKPCPNLIKVSYTQIKADPKEIEMRLSRVFDTLFEEVMRIRGEPMESKLEQEVLTK
mgnify:CR=1 FL=1